MDADHNAKSNIQPSTAYLTQQTFLLFAVKNRAILMHCSKLILFQFILRLSLYLIQVIFIRGVFVCVSGFNVPQVKILKSIWFWMCLVKHMYTCSKKFQWLQQWFSSFCVSRYSIRGVLMIFFFFKRNANKQCAIHIWTVGLTECDSVLTLMSIVNVLPFFRVP